jgi:protein associated with RNAse G/E
MAESERQKMKKYEYPNDLWATITDENNKLVDINLFSDGKDKYLAIYERENPKQMEFSNCVAHYKLKENK